MRTVNEVSKLSGVSVRTLHHYDAVGLLKPTAVTEAGYRLYDDTALERLQQILLFRELEFSLKEIAAILDSPNFDRERALEQQIALLSLKKERLERLIGLAREVKQTGVNRMDFTAFDTERIDAYTAQAKAAYGQTREYREFEERSAGRGEEETRELNSRMMELFAQFGGLRSLDPGAEAVQAQVKKLRDFITEHFYTCSDEVLHGLGAMYAADEAFTQSIDRAGGAGTVEFVSRAIKAYG